MNYCNQYIKKQPIDTIDSLFDNFVQRLLRIVNSVSYNFIIQFQLKLNRLFNWTNELKLIITKPFKLLRFEYKSLII